MLPALTWASCSNKQDSGAGTNLMVSPTAWVGLPAATSRHQLPSHTWSPRHRLAPQTPCCPPARGPPRRRGTHRPLEPRPRPQAWAPTIALMRSGRWPWSTSRAYVLRGDRYSGLTGRSLRAIPGRRRPITPGEARHPNRNVVHENPRRRASPGGIRTAVVGDRGCC